MKKIIFIILLFTLTIMSFAASELDSLLKDDDEVFSELTTDETKLVPKEAYVEKLSGQAFLKRNDNDKWFQIIENTPIKEKDTVLTMENTEIKIRLENNSYINIGSKSKLYFETMRGKPQEEKMTETGLKLAWGKIFSNVRKKLETGGKYEIEAGSVVAGVRGTQYLVTLNKKGIVSIKVFEGKVFVVPIETYKKQQSSPKRSKEKTTDKKITDKTDSDENTTLLVETSDEGKIEEIVLVENEEVIVEKTGEIGNITIHNDSAPVNSIKEEEVKEQIKEIKKEAVENLNLSTTQETKNNNTIDDNTIDDNLKEQLEEVINQVEESAEDIVEEADSTTTTTDVIINIR